MSRADASNNDAHKSRTVWTSGSSADGLLAPRSERCSDAARPTHEPNSQFPRVEALVTIATRLVEILDTAMLTQLLGHVLGLVTADLACRRAHTCRAAQAPRLAAPAELTRGLGSYGGDKLKLPSSGFLAAQRKQRDVALRRHDVPVQKAARMCGAALLSTYKHSQRPGSAGSATRQNARGHCPWRRHGGPDGQAAGAPTLASARPRQEQPLAARDRTGACVQYASP